MERDVFVCHASEDKKYARELVYALQQEGAGVWFDEYELEVGDSIRSAIEKGLADSRFGVVILSHNFFAKHWPQKELDGLTALESSDGRSRVLPVWLDIDQPSVAGYAPMLAGIYALESGKGIQAVATGIIRKVHIHRASSTHHSYLSSDLDIVQLARENSGSLDSLLFQRCRLRGPAVIALLDCSLSGMIVAEHMLVEVDPNKHYAGIIPASRCIFDRCHFDDIAFAAPGDVLDELRALPYWPEDEDGPPTAK
jgi:hypothetical protein